MNLRSKTILEAAIKEYIKTGAPVSSQELEKRYDFGVKEATIRNELNRLTKEGFLDQLHTSGGRVPTDKGYQFFVAGTLDDVIDSKKILESRYGDLAGDLRRGKLKEFIDAFSGETKLLGVGKKEKEKAVYKSGLHELFDNVDLNGKEEMREIIRDFEMLDSRLEEMRGKLFRILEKPQIFIGKQSPITKSNNLSVIVDSYDLDNDKVLIAVIGPKRMDYNKMLKFFKSFRKQLE